MRRALLTLAATLALGARAAGADDTAPAASSSPPGVTTPAASPALPDGDATPEAPARAIVVHVPPLAAAAGEPIVLEAMIDAPYAETLSVQWRARGERAWQTAPFARSSAGGWFASLPAADARGVEYYVRGVDASGVERAHFASDAEPHLVRVEPRLFDRLEQLDVERLRGRRNEVSIDLTAHNFGNRHDLRDRFSRVELVYAYRLLRQVHEIGFGFGALQGRTPAVSEPGGRELYRAARYGFGQVRLRAHPSVFVDARIGLGVSHDGFAGNGRAAVTFGKPWRSCVQIGGEVMGDLGPSGWVRLQWDTARPVLMGAAIVRTDLPGVAIDRAGLYLAYDVAYRIDDRFAVRGQLSYGARDGAAHVGGGMATSLSF